MVKTEIVVGTQEDRNMIEAMTADEVNPKVDLTKMRRETGWFAYMGYPKLTQDQIAEWMNLGAKCQCEGYGTIKVLVHRNMLWVNKGQHLRGIDRVCKMFEDLTPSLVEQDRIAIVREWLGRVKALQLKDFATTIINGCKPLPTDLYELAEETLNTFIGLGGILDDVIAEAIEDHFKNFLQTPVETEEPVEMDQIMKDFMDHIRDREKMRPMSTTTFCTFPGCPIPIFISVREDDDNE